MDTLQIGTEVWVQQDNGQFGWEPILAFMHYDPDTIESYYRLRYRVPGYDRRFGAITASARHLLLSDGNHMKPTGEFQVGDALNLADGSRTVVEEVQPTVQSRGAYSPLTYSGTIVVDGIVASCYAPPKGVSHRHAHWAMAPARWFYWWRALAPRPSKGILPYCEFLTQVAISVQPFVSFGLN